MKYKISFVIPIYNSQKYLRECVDSIIAQDCFDETIQIVLSDDGSTDASAAICDMYSQRFENIKALLPLEIPMVVGTTGWNDKKDEVASLAAKCGGTIMTSANFSIGVNILYKIVEDAARLANKFSEYDAAIWEMHHNQKADSPSGTALEIANHLLSEFKRKNSIVTNEFKEKPLPNQLHVSSTRCGTVPGTHKVFFDCEADTIEIAHTARSRKGFANGAVHALENLSSMLKEGKLKSGALYGMNDIFPELF